MATFDRDRPVRWGILGAARIADDAVLPALRRCRLAEPVAIAARDRSRAAAMAARHGVSRAYGSYDELLADPAIDIVYVALPNHLHVEWTRRAASCGKHVLVEKPIALDRAELARLDGIDPAIRIAEAFMVRHQPRWRALQARLASGEHGAVRSVDASLSFTLLDPGDYRARPECGGGALYDLGCYLAMAARLSFGCEPVRAFAECRRDHRGIDVSSSAILDFGDGRHALLAASVGQAASQSLRVVCDRAALDLPRPFITRPDESTVLRVETGAELRQPGCTTLGFDAVDQYEEEVANFSRAVRGEEAPFWGLDDARANMAALDAMFASAACGVWAPVAS